MKKINRFWFFLWISMKNKRFNRWFFQKIWLWIEKKKFVIEKITTLDYIFDTKDFMLCVVYDKTVDEKSFENLSIKFVILQTKKKCQSFFNSKIVNSRQNVRNKTININENKNIALNAQTLITRKKFWFSFNLKSVFLITRRKVLKKRSKKKSFKKKELFEKLN